MIESAFTELCSTRIVAPLALAVPRRSVSIAASFKVTFSGFNCMKPSCREVGLENLRIECFKSAIESWPGITRVHS